MMASASCSASGRPALRLAVPSNQKLGTRTLQPGMPVEVVLKTGERSLLAYMLHPLTKRLAAAMKEE